MDYFSAIRAFLYAGELGSFSKAAEKIAVKTSTVSRYIDLLERDLGITLFNRSTRGLVLTEGGRVFRKHALVVIKNLDEAREITASLNSSPQGLLRITMPHSFGRRHIIKHFPAFMQRYPKIDIVTIITDQILNLIDAEIDLAIRIGTLPDSQLMARQLAVHHRVVCASQDYVAQHGAPTSPDQLANHSAIRLGLEDKWLLMKGEHGSLVKDISVQLSSRLRVDDTEAALLRIT